MHRVVPELIVENYRLGRFRGEFPSVVMFMDLSGFSTMTDALMQHGQHGAEVLAGLMHGVFDPLVESVFDYGGKIIGFAGDGMMALFPIQTETSSTTLYALTSAYVIQKRLRQQSTYATVYGKFAISAKIGLAIGSVSWGILVSANRDQATYYFRGTPVNEAAEAEHHASAGAVLLTPEVVARLPSGVETDSCGSFRCLRALPAKLPPPSRGVFPPVDLNVSRLFMPAEVIAYDMRGEFRQVVNLFMRFPDLSEQQLHILVDKVFELRGKYGGLLNRLDFGDKGCNLLMLWGAPVAYENDIGRALNFLLDLKAQVDFPITSGVTYYIAHAGYLGSVMCEDYTCYGWGVNLASRFMMNAPSGETWVDDRIARRVSKRFEVEFIGSQWFKGFALEQKVHRLSGHKRAPEPMYQGELVGRKEELTQLTRFLEPLWQNRFAGLMLVSGDAGIGKGRLVYELRSSKMFDGRNIRWAVCHSDQILRQSLNPWRSWLYAYFEISPNQSLDERKQIFTEKINDLINSIDHSELAQEVDRTRSFLGALLDLYWDGSLYEQLDGEGRYNNALLALITLLKAESLRQPVVIFIEDFQFIDTDSKQFLPQLKRAIFAASESYPIAIVVTTRPSMTSLDHELIDAQIDLQGLNQEAIAHLAEIMLGGAVASPLVNVLFRRSEGNPYFVEQILRYLQEENLIEMSREGWSLVRRLREDFLPADIRSILVARLDQLTREVKLSIQTASVLGREFELRVLLQMLHDDENVPTYVSEAEKAAIWAPLNEIRYIFTHGLLRDAAYEMQMRARRRELHALAVEALESLYSGNLKGRYAEIAYHADHAELSSKAQLYYALAAKVSADLYQNSQAAEYYTRALAYVPFDDVSARFSLLLERQELFTRLGDRISQRADLETLEELAIQLNDRRLLAKVNVLFAHYYISISDYPAVILHSERVLELDLQQEDADVVLDAYRVWPLALLRQGKLEDAMRVARKGQQLANRHGDPIKEAYILNSMGLIAIEQKTPAIAHGYLQRALSIAQEKGDRRLESRTLGNLGSFSGYVQQDYASAREYFEKDLAICQERGDRTSQSVALGNLGWAAGMQGEFQAARSYHGRALQLSREVGNLYLEINTLINLSAVAGAEYDAHTSLDYAHSALDRSRKSGDRSSEAWSLLYLGYAYLLLNDLPQAEECFQGSITIREQLGQPGMKTEPSAGLVQVLMLKGELAEAAKEAEKIVMYLDGDRLLKGAEEPLRVYYACYLAFEQAKHPLSLKILGGAAQLLDSHLSKLRDEDSRKMYVENVPWRLAIQNAWREKSA